MRRNDQRSLLSPGVDPRARLRLLLPFLVLVGAVVILGWATNNIITSVSEQFAGALAGQGPVLDMFHQFIHKLKTAIWIYLAFITLLAIILWAFYSFRIFGPQVAIRRHVKALIAGDYSSRVHLREHDEFMDLADELNQLAESLKESRRR